MSTSVKSITLGLTAKKEARERKEREGMANLYEAIDQGWRYFWSRRSIPAPPVGCTSGHVFNPDQRKAKDCT